MAIIGSSIIAKCPTPRWWSATDPRAPVGSCVPPPSTSRSFRIPEAWLTARLGPLATFVRELDADTSVPAARRAALHDVAHTLAAIASTTQPQPNPSEQETHP